MTITELLGVALKIEGAGYSYYTKLAQKSSDKVRALFEELANDERTHAKTFEEIIKEYEDKNLGNLNEEEIGYATTYAQEIIFPKLNDDSIPSTLRDALKKAIEVEKDSIIFYTDIQALIPELKLLEKIIEEEKKHLKKLTMKLNDEDSFDMFSEGSMI
ncbi:MAG: ferritin family protein [Thermosipho sp. (in: Bacteria)]|nr:ferritin family protein [Thermosipho sp. (in: thermotogales)]